MTLSVAGWIGSSACYARKTPAMPVQRLRVSELHGADHPISRPRVVSFRLIRYAAILSAFNPKALGAEHPRPKRELW